MYIHSHKIRIYTHIFSLNYEDDMKKMMMLNTAIPIIHANPRQKKNRRCLSALNVTLFPSRRSLSCRPRYRAPPRPQATRGNALSKQRDSGGRVLSMRKGIGHPARRPPIHTLRTATSVQRTRRRIRTLSLHVRNISTPATEANRTYTNRPVIHTAHREHFS